MTIFKGVKIEEDILTITAGTLTIEAVRDGAALLYRTSQQESVSKELFCTYSKKEEMRGDWNTWIVDTKESYELFPALPNLPLVVKFTSDLLIMPKKKVELYVEIPLFVACNKGKSYTNTLFAEPSVSLKKTWFGESTQGELAYFLTSAVTTNSSQLLNCNFTAIAPVLFINSSNEYLHCNKILLTMSNLTLYASNEHLWTDKQTIRYRGVTEKSLIKNMGKPQAIPEGKVILRGQKPDLTELVRKSVDSLLDVKGA